MLLCKFCNKECKNNNSLRNHERLCKLNENRQTTFFQTEEFQKAKKVNPKNQYTKALELGLPKPQLSLEARRKISERNLSRSKEWNIENGKRISKSINEKVKNNEWHTSLAKNMHINYNGVDLHGSWELKYAQFLDENNIPWIRNKDKFEYIFDGKIRKYTPDFYLPKSDEYIEIKGFKTLKDEAKWSQFPKHKKLVILLKSELKELNII